MPKRDYPGELLEMLHYAIDLQPVREYKFHPVRRWRFDLAWPTRNLAVEVDGGIWIEGRHTRGSGVMGDCEKYNEAMLFGWRVLRVTPEHITNGMALSWIERALISAK